MLSHWSQQWRCSWVWVRRSSGALAKHSFINWQSMEDNDHEYESAPLMTLWKVCLWLYILYTEIALFESATHFGGIWLSQMFPVVKCFVQDDPNLPHSGSQACRSHKSIQEVCVQWYLEGITMTAKVLQWIYWRWSHSESNSFIYQRKYCMRTFW